MITSQGRMEVQRSRIVRLIAGDGAKNSIKYEKILLDIEERINRMLLKIKGPEGTERIQQIEESKVKEMVLFLIVKYRDQDTIKKDNMIAEMTNLIHGTYSDSLRTYSYLENIGLGCCERYSKTESSFDLLEFALLREWIMPGDSFVAKIESYKLLLTEFALHTDRNEDELEKEHGIKEKWDDKVWDEFEKRNERFEQHCTQTKARLVSEMLEIAVSQENRQKYARCIDVFFGKN